MDSALLDQRQIESFVLSLHFSELPFSEYRSKSRRLERKITASDSGVSFHLKTRITTTKNKSYPSPDHIREKIVVNFNQQRRQ